MLFVLHGFFRFCALQALRAVFCASLSHFLNRESQDCRPRGAETAITEGKPDHWLCFSNTTIGLRNSGEEAEWCGAHMATTRRRMDRISTVAPPTSYESASTRASVETDEPVDETN